MFLRAHLHAGTSYYGGAQRPWPKAKQGGACRAMNQTCSDLPSKRAETFSKFRCARNSIPLHIFRCIYSVVCIPLHIFRCIPSATEALDRNCSYHPPASMHDAHKPMILHALFAQDLFELPAGRQVLHAAKHNEHWPKPRRIASKWSRFSISIS